MTTFVTPRGFSERLSEQCFRHFPCLSNRARRSSLGLKAALLLLHVVFVGVLFLFDTDLTQNTREDPWYTAAYLLLFLATLIQYSILSSSSPGFVIDAMTAVDGSHSIYQIKPASQSGTLISSTKNDQLGSHNSQMNSSSSLKLVTHLYPLGSYIRTWTCSYCNVIQVVCVCGNISMHLDWCTVHHFLGVKSNKKLVEGHDCGNLVHWITILLHLSSFVAAFS